MLLRDFVPGWLAQRRALGNRSVDDDECRVRKHLLPVFGKMRLDQVRPSHVRTFVLGLRTREPKLAPRTIRNIAVLGSALFRDAVAEELLLASPWVLPRRTLPRIVDRDPAWRLGAVYAREEVERLLSTPELLPDRRMFYGLKALAGLRHTEAAHLRWRDYDRQALPLGALHVVQTKADKPRKVPVHPVLARMLATWRVIDWPRVFDRPAGLDDWIVPTRRRTPRLKCEAAHQLRDDLARLKMRRRRGHDLRSWFYSTALVDGAQRDVMEYVMWGARGTGPMLAVYARFTWPQLCAEVAKLRVLDWPPSDGGADELNKNSCPHVCERCRSRAVNHQPAGTPTPSPKFSGSISLVTPSGFEPGVVSVPAIGDTDGQEDPE